MAIAARQLLLLVGVTPQPLQPPLLSGTCDALPLSFPETFDMKTAPLFVTAVAPLAVAAGSLLAAPAAALADAPAGIARLGGDWAGHIETGAQKLHFLLHVRTQNGMTVTTLDGPAKGTRDAPVTVTVEGSHVWITPFNGGTFQGELSRDAARLDGKWGGLPVHLRRAASSAVAEASH